MLTGPGESQGWQAQAQAAIWAYARVPVDPGWRTAAVNWDGTQVVADVGCGSAPDLRRLVAAGACRRAIGLDKYSVPVPARPLVRADARRLPLRDGSVDVAMALHVLHLVGDAHSAVRELRRIVRPGGTVLASADGGESLSEIYQLFADVIADQLGHPVTVTPASHFTLETGQMMLETEFSRVDLSQLHVPLSFPVERPLVAYLDSIRQPILSRVGEQFDYGAALDDFGARVGRVTRAHGYFRATSRSGVFACR